MTIQPSRPGSANRAALAARLTELRDGTGLSGNAFAARMGIVQSRLWKIENARLLPSENDIKAWARVAGREDATGDLLELRAAAKDEQAFSATFSRRGGATAYEERILATEQEHTRLGEFEVAVVPGLLQTADYARSVMSVPSGPRAWGSADADVEAKIGVRLRRQEALHDRSKRVQMVLAEAALRTLVSTPEIHLRQLEKLLDVLDLPVVELGIIPFGVQMPAYTIGGFRVYDDELVVVESISSEDDITDAEKVAVYVGAFEALREAAVTGGAARRLIAAAAAGRR